MNGVICKQIDLLTSSKDLISSFFSNPVNRQTDR